MTMGRVIVLCCLDLLRFVGSVPSLISLFCPRGLEMNGMTFSMRPYHSFSSLHEIIIFSNSTLDIAQATRGGYTAT